MADPRHESFDPNQDFGRVLRLEYSKRLIAAMSLPSYKELDLHFLVDRDRILTGQRVVAVDDLDGLKTVGYAEPDDWRWLL